MASLSSGRWNRRCGCPVFGQRALAPRRRRGEQVEHPSAVGAGAAPGDAPHQLAVVDLDQHHGIQRLARAASSSVVERVRLREVAREAVEDEARAAHPARASRSRIMPSTISSSTSRPRSMASLACTPKRRCPSRRPHAAGRRWRSAECRCRSTRRCDWVPLPEPGAPNRTIRMMCCSTSPLHRQPKVRHVTGRSRQRSNTRRAPAQGSARALFFRAPLKPAGPTCP